MAINLTMTMTPTTPLQPPLQDLPFWFYPKIKRSQAEIYMTKLSGIKSSCIQSSHEIYRDMTKLGVFILDSVMGCLVQ